MGKRKEGHSSYQTMASSSFSAAVDNAKAARLPHKGILWKEIKAKLPLIRLMSSSIQATSREEILFEINRSINSAKLHSTYNLKKLILWQNNRATLIIEAAVQKGFKFFCSQRHVAAKTSPLQFWISNPTPIDELFLDCEMARLNLWIESKGPVAILVKDELEPWCFFAKLPHIPAYIIQAVTTDP